MQNYSGAYARERDDLLGTGESHTGTLCKGMWVYPHADSSSKRILCAGMASTFRPRHAGTTPSLSKSFHPPRWIRSLRANRVPGTLCKGMWVYPHADTGKRILCAGMAKTFSPRYAGTKLSISKSFHPRRWIRSLRKNRGPELNGMIWKRREQREQRAERIRQRACRAGPEAGWQRVAEKEAPPPVRGRASREGIEVTREGGAVRRGGRGSFLEAPMWWGRCELTARGRRRCSECPMACRPVQPLAARGRRRCSECPMAHRPVVQPTRTRWRPRRAPKRWPG